MIWLFILFLTVPLLEIALFISIGQAIGLMPTLATVILTAIVGTWLVRSQGLSELGKLRNSLAGSGDPLNSIAHGAMILVAGLLLLTPGFFTDGVGFLLLVPAVRVLVTRAIAIRIQESAVFVSTSPGESRTGKGSDDIIDAEYDVIHESDVRDDGPSRTGGRGN